MSHHLKTQAISLFALLVSLSGSAVLAAEDIPAAPAFSIETLSSPQEDGWITNGGSLSNQRYSPLTQINRDNVAKLKGVWRADLMDSALEFRHNNQAQPLIYDGVLYIITGQNDVFAISVETGDVLWSRFSGLQADDAFVCCGWVSRGLGMGDGKIFVGQLDAKLIALDQKTGEVVWEIQDADPKLGYSLTAAPLYYEGMVITGYAGGDLGTRGRIRAYSADDGSEIWNFHTIPGPGEFGHDTWPADNEVWQYGGAPVWHTPAIDPEAGLIYFSTGNAGPVLGGAVRPGDNLFTASIVALDVNTGEYRWHFQEVHHDIWDYDAPNPIILFEAEYDGVMRKGLAQAGKTGWVYILDRITGEPLIGIEERAVMQEPRQATAATQPYPLGDSLIPLEVDYAPENNELVNQGRIFTPFFEEPVVFTPLAGVNWPPSAYDPATNYMYICATDVANSARADDSQYEDPTFTQQFLGGAYVGAGLIRRGIYSALDLKTNKLVWQRQFNDGCRSGSLVTAGGLVFMGRNDGRLIALDTRNGERVWEFRTDAPVNSGVSTFMHNGEQYIATYAGGGLFGGQKGDGVWLFSLNGILREVPSAPPGAGGPTTGIAVPEGHVANIDEGRLVYQQSCVYCHGDTGEGGHGGGAELTSALQVQDIMTMLGTGRNAMPNFRSVLTPEQAHDVATYLTAELLAQ